MGTMLDLPDALRAAGLKVWVAPDWKTNGHGYNIIEPYGGVLHHTAGYGLRAVYGLPDARPDVPQPRCNLWTPRAGTKPYDIAVISAGRAWQAGTNNSHAHERMKAGGFGAKTPDAAVLYGPNSDDLDGGYTSLHTLGNEVECSATAAAPDDFSPAQLDVVAVAMNVCVDVLGWPGLGCWAHHRQLTYRKPDMAYRGDIWGRAASLANPQEDDMPLNDADKAWLRSLTGAGGGITPVGVTQDIYNRLNATLAGLKGELDGLQRDVADIKQALSQVPPSATSGFGDPTERDA